MEPLKKSDQSLGSKTLITFFSGSFTFHRSWIVFSDSPYQKLPPKPFHIVPFRSYVPCPYFHVSHANLAEHLDTTGIGVIRLRCYELHRCWWLACDTWKFNVPRYASSLRELRFWKDIGDSFWYIENQNKLVKSGGRWLNKNVASPKFLPPNNFYTTNCLWFLLYHIDFIQKLHEWKGVFH